MTRDGVAARAHLATRLRRLEVQIKAFREMHVREVGDVADRLAAIAKLQADELQLILDELADILSAADAVAATATDPVRASETEAVPGDVTRGADPPAADPAAASPKRAKWLAEQERRAHLSRRKLLRGRDEP